MKVSPGTNVQNLFKSAFKKISILGMEIMIPAIAAARQNGIRVEGPHPADGFFASGAHEKVDAILSPYHDQGLVAFKILSFNRGTNFTAGLPFVRTSPDHGTAFDIAGQDRAVPDSMIQAIRVAADIARKRRGAP